MSIVLDKLVKNVEDALPKQYGWRAKDNNVDWKEFATMAANQFFEDHKDEVLEAAAMHVTTKIQRSKAYQQKIGEITAKMEANNGEE